MRYVSEITYMKCHFLFYNINMEEIYRYCDQIVENGVISKENLANLLKTLAKAKRTKNIRKKPEDYDPFKSRASTMNSRAKQKGINGRVTPEELKQLMEKQPCCQKCGRKNYLVFDHIVPFYRGGDNTIDNIQVLCRICNMEKGVGN